MIKRNLLIIFSFIFLACLFISLSQAQWQDIEQVVGNISFLSIFNVEDAINISLEYDGNTSKIKQQINDPSFDFAFDFWDYLGDVSTGHDVANGNFLQLSDDNNSNLIVENCISQQIELSQDKLMLYLEYQYFSEEILPGFDHSAFVILINDQLVYHQPVERSTNALIKTVVPLEVSQLGTVDLKICAGNTGDRYSSSWLRLYHLSSLVAPINAQSTLHIQNKNNPFTVEYAIDGQVFQETSSTKLSLQLSQKLDNELMVITSDDELLALPVIFFPNHLTNISQAQHCFEADNQLLMLFSITHQSQDYFQISCTETATSQSQWQSLLSKYKPYSKQELDLIRPSCLQNRCLFSQESPNNCSPTASIHIKSCDPSGQCGLSLSSTFLQNCQELLPTLVSKTVQINEIMFNPLGDDKGDWYEGEWVELYNPNWVDLDLDGYQIKDEAGWMINLNKNSCDANDNTSDEGETVILAMGFLVAFTRGRAIFNNTGDSVYLFDSEEQLIDQIAYPGSSLENLTYGRFPDGKNNWYPQMQPSPLEPNINF